MKQAAENLKRLVLETSAVRGLARNLTGNLALDPSPNFGSIFVKSFYDGFR